MGTEAVKKIKRQRETRAGERKGLGDGRWVDEMKLKKRERKREKRKGQAMSQDRNRGKKNRVFEQSIRKRNIKMQATPLQRISNLARII